MTWKLFEFMKGSISFEQHKLGQEGEDCWFGFNEVNTIPLQLQINFIELREDICGLWQPRYCIYDTFWQSPSVCSNRCTNSLHHYL